MYGNKWSLFITRMIIDHVVKEQYSLMIIFHQRNITFELPAETDQHRTCIYVTGCDLWPILCQCVQNWPSTKCISITLLVPWNHNLPQLGGLGGSPWVVPLHFGQRITMDFVMSVVVHSRGSHGSGQFHVMGPVPDHQMSQEDLFGKIIFKIDYLFYTSNKGGHWI